MCGARSLIERAWLAVSVCADVGRQALKGAKPHTPGFCRAALAALWRASD